MRSAEPAASKSERRWRCCPAGTRFCWPNSWRRWPRSRPSGCCRRSGCGRPPGRVGGVPVPDGQRAAVFDESLRLLRAVLDNDDVAFSGEFFIFAASVGIRPPLPLDIWLGGAAPGSVSPHRPARRRLAGQFPDPGRGPSRPGEYPACGHRRRPRDRTDHFGLSLAVADDGLPDAVVAAVRSRRPDADPATCSPPTGPPCTARSTARRRRPHEVRHPTFGATPIDEFIDRFIDELLPRQN